MRAFSIRHVPVILMALGTVACTALLGSFEVGAGGGGPGDGDGGGDGGGQEGGGVLGVNPAEAKVGILRAQLFKAAVDVTWSVQEGAAGGSIDAAGKYIAPDKPGTYHVIATSKADPKVTSMGTLTVVPLGMNLLVGKPGGPGNIDGPVTRARMRGPQGVGYLGGSGSNDVIVVADSGNHTIRKVTGGMVSTVAGVSGMTGSANGTGPAAMFDRPTTVVTDDNGKKVFVVDGGGSCVRKVDIDTGAVTTFAGKCGTMGHADSTDGTGATALFDRLDTIVLAPNKDALYACDIFNFRGIRRIDIPSGKTSTPITGLNNSCVMGSDFFTKNVYYNDNNNTNDLRRFPDPIPTNGASTSTCSPLLDNVGQMNNSFTAMTVDTGFGNSNDIYVSNYKGVINKCRLDTGTWTPFAGMANDQRVVDGPIATARFSRPSAMTVYSPQGNLYIADQNVIRRIRTGGGPSTTVDTVAGQASNDERIDGPRNVARLTFPFGIATDDAGGLFFTDVGFDRALNNTIRKFDGPSATVSTVAGTPYRYDMALPPVDGIKEQAKFGIPFDMVRVGGDLFVLDLYGEAIRKVTIATGEVKTLAGELNVAGKSEGVGAAAHFQFIDPMASDGSIGNGLATDGTNLYVSDSANFAIRKIVIATGTVSTLAGGTKGAANGTGSAAQFTLPAGLVFVDGFLYVADTGDDTIRKIDVKTGEVTTLIGFSGVAADIDGDASKANLNHPARVVYDGNGNLFVSESPFVGAGIGIIRRIDLKTKTISPFAGTLGKSGFSTGPLPSTMNCPSGMAIAKNGDLVFGDACDGIVAAISPL